MDVKFWPGGLQPYEVTAIERLQKVFQQTILNQKQNPKLNSSMKSNTFPWRGYAGFRFSDTNRDGEFDLIIITHKIIVIVELKHWYGKITQCDGTWYQNGEDRGRSAVANTQEKVYLLMKKLEKVKDIFPNKKVPFIQFQVVFTAQCDFSELPDNEKNHVIHIDDFIKITNPDVFNKVFSQEPWRKAGLNSCIPEFDKFMNKGNIKPKDHIVDGYIAKDEIFKHPTEIYREYEAENRYNKDDKALLRSWDFSKLETKDNSLLNPEGRYKIISREKDVIVHLKSLNESLSENCLGAMSNPDPKSIMQQYAQLFVLPMGYSRLNEFINRYIVSYELEDRVDFVKILFKQFSDLHNLQVAHRDIGDHSIWFSPQSKIRLSNFIAAYYQPKGTVGKLRDDLSISAIQLPEDLNKKLQGTPFTRDVFSLGVVAWHILNGQSLPLCLTLEYIKNIRSKLAEYHNWYDGILEKCLIDNPQDRFSSASQLLDRLNDTAPKPEINFEFDQVRLNIYRHDKIVDRVYPWVKDLLPSKNNKEIYLSSENLCVKTWVIDNFYDLNQCYKLYKFFEKIQCLKDLDYSFIPKIEDFGLDKRNTPFLVQKFIEAETWDKIDYLSFEDAIKLSICLFQMVQNLHEQNIFHGDLHPENILVMKSDKIEDYEIYLLDIVDIDDSGTESFNHRYSPIFDNPTFNQRDNYAALKLSFDLLGYDVNNINSIKCDIIQKAFNVENLSEIKYISLDRLQDSYKDILSFKQDAKVINIGFPDFLNYCDYDIFPDNGKIYLDIKNNKSIYLSFYGVGGSFSCIYDLNTKKVLKTQDIKQQEYINNRIVRDAILNLDNISFKLTKQKYSNLDELNLYLHENEDFLNLIDQYSISLKEDSFVEKMDESFIHSIDDIEIPINEEIEIIESSEKNDLGKDKFYKKYSMSKIWKSILDTELEALPILELSDDKVIKDGNLHKLKYISETALLENFGNDDDVRFGIILGDRFSSLGKVNLQRSTAEILVLEYFNESNKNRIKLDQEYTLQSKKNKSSFIRRKNAMDRILEKQSVISNLLDYFDGGCNLKPSYYDVDVTEEDFKVYENKSKGYGLNEAQKAAFRKLLNYGPIGFLQGPPGTGKTEFIGAFTHFLISKLGVKNILLTSQSHEAVNTASERIRELCRKNNIDLDMVRFSNREQVVSGGLLDVYSGTLLTKQYQTFEAEYKNRIIQLSTSIGVSREFLKDLVYLDQTLNLFIKKLYRINKDLQDQDNNDLRKELIKQKEDLSTIIHDESKNYDLIFNIHSFDNIIQQAQYYLANKHGVNPHQLKKSVSIIEISNDFTPRLSSSYSNFDEFLMRSRTVVCGTCVGLGLNHIGLSNNRFDWVIIDEAARSSPTELAIAMQVGKRVLLVGDHHQLPPTYQEEHLQAIARSLGVFRKSSEFEQIMQSDFERGYTSPYGEQVHAMLSTQYRMQAPIGNLVSDVFYPKKLFTGKREIPDYFDYIPEKIKSVVTWVDTSKKKQNMELEKIGNKFSNACEAQEVISLLKNISENETFIESLLDEYEKDSVPLIGIICMYAEQKKLILQKFNALNWSEDLKKLVKIDTVDSYQGKENRIIIVSLVRSNEENKVGFLFKSNRINVALSRAKDRLIIVGNKAMWENERNINLPLGQVLRYIQNPQNNKSEYNIITVEK